MSPWKTSYKEGLHFTRDLDQLSNSVGQWEFHRLFMFVDNTPYKKRPKQLEMWAYSKSKPIGQILQQQHLLEFRFGPPKKNTFNKTFKE